MQFPSSADKRRCDVVLLLVLPSFCSCLGTEGGGRVILAPAVSGGLMLCLHGFAV